MRKDFYDVQNHVVAMIRREKQITALRLLSIVCEKFPPLPPKRIVDVKEKPIECSEQPLMELVLEDDTAAKHHDNMFAILKRVGYDGKEEKTTS